MSPAGSSTSNRDRRCQNSDRPLRARDGLGLLGCAGLELQGQRVDAVALTSGSRSIGEDMAQVASAAGTGDLGAAHAEGGVVVLVDDAVGDSLGEARPSRPRVELVVGAEQLGPARRAAEQAGVVHVEQRPGPGRLGALLTQHVVAVRRELRLPLVLCLHDLWFHGL